MTELTDALEAFRLQNGITTKGKLASVLHLSRMARRDGLPLDSSKLITEGGGQVLGLGRSSVQKILGEYGITRMLAAEAGRTSRGSMGWLLHYIPRLNQLHAKGIADTEAIEAWWVDRIRDFFNSKPFNLKYDNSRSFRSTIRDLLDQAMKRQKENPGTMYCGSVMQHLVGAALEIAMPDLEIAHHGSNVADAVSDRDGDFNLDDVSIHVTTMPTEALLRKCCRNIEGGIRPVIVTLNSRIAAAEATAEMLNIGNRVDIFDIEQFVSAKIYEVSRFRADARRSTTSDFVAHYNTIVDAHETDHSLKLEIGERA